MAALLEVTSSLDGAPSIPSGSDWWEKYGAVGFVAFLALAALAYGLRHYLTEKSAEAKRVEAEKAALRQMIEGQQRSLEALNRQMVEMVQTAHEETLELMDQQRDDHEKRFQALLERHMQMTEKWAEKTQEIAAVVAKTIDSLSRKLRDGG